MCKRKRILLGMLMAAFVAATNLLCVLPAHAALEMNLVSNAFSVAGSNAEAWGLALVDDDALGAANNGNIAFTYLKQGSNTAVGILDVSDPDAPKVARDAAWSIANNGTDQVGVGLEGSFNRPNLIVYYEGYVFVSGRQSSSGYASNPFKRGLLVLQVENPDAPPAQMTLKLVGNIVSYTNYGTVDETSTEYIRSVLRDGDEMFLLDGGGCRIFDLPALKATLDEWGPKVESGEATHRDLALEANKAVTRNLGNKTIGTLLPNMEQTKTAHSNYNTMAVSEDYVALVPNTVTVGDNQTNNRKITVVRRSDWSIVGELDYATATGVETRSGTEYGWMVESAYLDGDKLVMGNKGGSSVDFEKATGSIYVLDISKMNDASASDRLVNIKTPAPGKEDFRIAPQGVYLKNNVVYFATHNYANLPAEGQKLFVMDITDPTHAKFIGNSAGNYTNVIQFLDISGRLYVASRNQATSVSKIDLQGVTLSMPADGTVVRVPAITVSGGFFGDASALTATLDGAPQTVTQTGDAAWSIDLAGLSEGLHTFTIQMGENTKTAESVTFDVGTRLELFGGTYSAASVQAGEITATVNVGNFTGTEQPVTVVTGLYEKSTDGRLVMRGITSTTTTLPPITEESQVTGTTNTITVPADADVANSILKTFVWDSFTGLKFIGETQLGSASAEGVGA